MLDFFRVISAAGMNLRRSMTVPLQYMPLKFRANQQRKRYRSKSIANQTTKAQKKITGRTSWRGTERGK